MTQEDFDRATLAEQILYNCTGMLAKNHPTIIEVMDKYHQAKLKLPIVSNRRELLNALADEFNDSTHTYVGQPLIEKILKVFNCG